MLGNLYLSEPTVRSNVELKGNQPMDPFSKILIVVYAAIILCLFMWIATHSAQAALIALAVFAFFVALVIGTRRY